jgi:predicted ATPase
MSSRRNAPATNLPVERGSFVGRVKLLDEIARHIDGGSRLVSITGPEGIGKTRVALRAAALELPRFGGRGGVWCIDVSETAEPRALLRDIGQLFSIDPDLGAPLAAESARVLDAIRAAGPMLMLLDGLDRASKELVGALKELLDDAVDLRCFVTARRELGVTGEQVVKVSALKVPKQGVDPRTVSHSEAVSLFVERASESKRGYTPTTQDIAAISQIVRLLDGVPLAIEIAAARLRALSPQELVERLPRKVSALVGTSGSASQRSALAGAVAWSLDLLPPWEIATLAQAAVFRGGFDADAAREVIDLSAFADAPQVPAALESLLEKSLLRVVEPVSRGPRTESASGPRYEMPSVVREFADARLSAEGTREPLVRRHSSHYLRAGGAWAENVDSHGGLVLRRRLELESENLLAVARRALLADPQTLVSVTTALRAVLALEPVLLVRGPIEVFLELMDRALEPADAVGVPFALRARCHEARARAHRVRHQLHKSAEDLETALALARRARDRLLEGRALANLGTHHLLLGQYSATEAEYADALIILREVGDRRVEGRALGHIGLLEQQRGNFDQAIERYKEAIAIHIEVGDRRWEGIHTGQLGAAHLEAADGSARRLDDARMHIKRALAIHKELGNRRFEATTLVWLGDLYALQGDREDAKEAWERAHALARQVGDPRVELLALARTGALAARVQERAVADELFLRARGIADRLQEKSLVDVVALCERRAPSGTSTGEAQRSAERVVRALGN